MSHSAQNFSKIRPPAGFALEKCKSRASKSARAKKLLWQFSLHTTLLWAVIAFVMWDRATTSYWEHNSMHNLVENRHYNVSSDVKARSQILPWIRANLIPTVLYDDAAPAEYSPLNLYLLGKVFLYY